MENFTLYSLIDPRNNSVFYIGITKLSLNERLYEHCKKNQKFINLSKFKIIAKLKKLELKPIIQKIFSNLTKEEALFLEKEAILAYRASGFSLENITDGGNSNYIYTPEQRKIAAERMKGTSFALGNKLTKKQKQRVSEVHKGKSISEEQKEKTKNVMIQKYGTTSVFQLPHVRDKANKSIREKFGIKIYQYDKDMNFINSYKTIVDACYILLNTNKKEKIRHTHGQISKHKNTNILYKGFYWFTFIQDIQK